METGIADFRDYSLCAITINYLHKFINQIHTCFATSHVKARPMQKPWQEPYTSHVPLLPQPANLSSGCTVNGLPATDSEHQWTNVTMKCKVLPATNAGSIPWQHAIVNVPIFSGAWNSKPLACRLVLHQVNQCQLGTFCRHHPSAHSTEVPCSTSDNGLSSGLVHVCNGLQKTVHILQATPQITPPKK